ncbi:MULTISPECIES: flagellar hook capping FlgD N-terminal domain-containing protein [unclassified Ruegeria]|uniref:flagellar hook capping FlgD N-terminal domain-containing protein n=1 Tax=unclassified Ruegeria TaxID=2625375 RepID=UPI00148A0A46|nr:MULTISPECIES: flagellar hook capping FlgD N-terminal domain-containing protein [unclassified Ruegeria]
MISETSATTQSNTGQSQANNAHSSALTSDFETFLLMLTTQARNQDPLEPLDSSEYASQLAQFSMAEQQVQTNDLLSELALALGSVNLEELGNWVGVDVRSTAAFQFTDEPITLTAAADPNADQAKLVIRDASGEVVDTAAIAPDQNEFQWAGVDSSGAPFPTGSYSATLESYENGEIISTSPVASYSRVVEAQVEGGSVVLTLDSGATIAADSISGVRASA